MQPESMKQFYTIESNEPIGQGAYAKVVKGRENKTGKIVAIKIYQKQRMDEEEAISLQKQIHIMKNIHHPNIVDFYDYYSDKKNMFLVLEYLSGGELYDQIIQSEHFSENQAKEALLPIIDAVRYLHESGIVHRDLKPENIVYSSRGANRILKIIDFGVSQIISAETHLMSTAIGTPLYMAPEILKGQKYDEKVDWWSIGVIMYVLLCGYPPFYSESQQQLQNLIKKGKVVFEPDQWDIVSDQAKNLIVNLLNVDPEKRFGIQQILNHSWIMNDAKKEKLQVPERMKKFAMRFRKIINALKAVNVMKGK